MSVAKLRTAGAVLVTVSVVTAVVAAVHTDHHHHQTSAKPAALTSSSRGRSTSTSARLAPTSARLAPTSARSTSSAQQQKSCDVAMPASWAAIIAAGRLGLPRAQNRAISTGPDTTLLIDSAVVNAHGRSEDRLLLVDRAGGSTVIWRAAHPSTESLQADGSAAISTGWVVFLVDRSATSGAQTGYVMAFDRSTRTTRLIGTTTSDAAPIVVDDAIYWFKTTGDPSVAPASGTALGQNLTTGTQILRRAETQTVSFLRLRTHVLWRTGDSGALRSPTLSIPAAVSKAFAGTYLQSDGSVLYAAQAHGTTLAVRRWAPGATSVSTYPFESARGLSDITVAFPYLSSTIGNPGESGFLIDLRSGMTIRVAGGLVLSSVTAGQVVFTSSTTRQFGPTAVYRLPLASLPAPHC